MSAEQHLVGRLLLAAPSLLDPNFRRSVVLIVAHDAEGALGLILDRPSGLNVSETAPALTGLVDPTTTLHVGGPVRATAIVVLAEYRDEAACEHPILGRVGLLTSVEPGAGDHIVRARVFAGYAGWGSGQLEAEIATGSWLVVPARPADVFAAEPAGLWGRAIRRLGPAYRLFASLPREPRLN
jgi:putative transcriptional regulator